MERFPNRAPVKPRNLECFNRVRISDSLASCRVAELGETSKLISSTCRHRSRQFLLEIAEKQKRRLRSELLTHEEQRRGRIEQKDGRCRTNRAGIRQGENPFPESPIANLIVILQERDKRRWRQASGRLTTFFATTIERGFALIGKSLNQATAQPIERAIDIVGIVTVLFAGYDHMQSVVDVIIPLRVVCARLAPLRPTKITRLVAIILEDQMNLSKWPDGAANRFGQFRENVRSGVVQDGVHRVQAQTIEMILGQPIQGVVDEEIPDRPASGAIEIEGIAPRGVMTIAEKLRRIKPEIVSFRTKVVVDDVQENHHAARVSGLD